MVDRRLRVDADLRLTVNGRSAQLTGSGQQLRVVTADPAQLWADVSGAELPPGWTSIGGPRAIGRVADQLQQQGLTVTVAAPSGAEFVRLGSAATSRLGRWTTRSEHVQFGAARTLLPTAAQLVRHGATRLPGGLRRIAGRLRRTLRGAGGGGS